jgi:hypothetical protein
MGGDGRIRRPASRARVVFSGECFVKVAIEVVGWIAALLILTAYGLLSSGRRSGRSKLYQWMNIVGAAGFVINSGLNHAFPSAGLNAVWICIGAYALIKNARAGTTEP